METEQLHVLAYLISRDTIVIPEIKTYVDHIGKSSKLCILTKDSLAMIVNEVIEVIDTNKKCSARLRTTVLDILIEWDENDNAIT